MRDNTKPTSASVTVSLVRGGFGPGVGEYRERANEERSNATGHTGSTDRLRQCHRPHR